MCVQCVYTSTERRKVNSAVLGGWYLVVGTRYLVLGTRWYKIAHSLRVERRVSNHDVPVYGYGQYGEQRHGQQPVSDQRKEPAEQLPVYPRPVPERGRGQRQVEAAETQVGHAEVDDEHGRRVAHLKHPTAIEVWIGGRAADVVILLIYYII